MTESKRNITIFALLKKNNHWKVAGVVELARLEREYPPWRIKGSNPLLSSK